MNYIQNLFSSIKLMFLQVILVEFAVIRMVVEPTSLHEYLNTYLSGKMYIEHILLAIIFLSLGALIFLKKADFFVQNTQE